MYQSSLQGREERGSSYHTAKKKLLKIFRFLTQSLERLANGDVKAWKVIAAFTHSGEDTSSSNPSLWQLYCWSGIFYRRPSNSILCCLIAHQVKAWLSLQVIFFLLFWHIPKREQEKAHKERLSSETCQLSLTHRGCLRWKINSTSEKQVYAAVCPCYWPQWDEPCTVQLLSTLIPCWQELLSNWNQTVSLSS